MAKSSLFEGFIAASLIIMIITLLPSFSFCEIQMITHTVKQPFGGSQSPDDARISAIAKAKREALEMAGVYVEALTIVKDAKVDKDEILALAAGVLKTEVVSQENYHTKDAFGIDVVVKVVVDTSVLEGRVKKLLQDRTHLDQLNQARKKEKELLDRMAILEKENRSLMAKKESSKDLKKQFQETSQELTAVDWYEKAATLWDITLSGANTSTYQLGITDGGKKAIEYLSSAIKLKHDYSTAYLTRGNIHSSIGQKSLAMKDFEKVVQLEKPKDSFGYARRGSAYKGLKDYQKALQDYDYAIQLQPDNNPFYYLSRGFIYIELKQYQRAIKDFDEGIRRLPDEANAYQARGLVHLKIGQYQQAIKDFDQVIRLKPDYADAYSGRADVYSSMRIFERAIEDYSRVILLRPGYLDYLSRGNVYGILGQSKQAIRDFDQAILLKPDDALAYFSRGLEYAGQDQYHLAIQDYDQAIFLKPDYAAVYKSRGLAYMVSGNTLEGCSSLIRACELGDCKAYHSNKSKGLCR